METVLRALGADTDDPDAAAQVARLQSRLARRKRGKEEPKERDVMVDPKEILQILPHMSKDEKRQLYKALRKEEEEEAFQQLPVTAKPKRVCSAHQTEGSASQEKIIGSCTGTACQA